MNMHIIILQGMSSLRQFFLLYLLDTSAHTSIVLFSSRLLHETACIPLEIIHVVAGCSGAVTCMRARAQPGRTCDFDNF